jgi:hypothetical protein
MKLKNLLTTTLTAAVLFISTGTSWGQALLVENFDYTVGTQLITNGWAVTGTTTSNPIMVTAPSITYPGYLGSGVGSEITMTTSGEDLHKTFTPQSAGYVYVAFLVNFTSAGTGDYFIHLGPDVMGTAFIGRLFVKLDGSNIAFGITHSSGGTPTYTTSTYDLNTTYLVVLKVGVVDKTSAIIINPEITSTEPTTGWTSNTTGTTDYTTIGSIGVRQGSTTAGVSSTQKIDAIRVGTTWTDVVTSGTSVNNNDFANFSAYPNPFNNQISISNPAAVKRVVISNLIGQNVLDINTNGTATIETSNLSAGVYMVSFVAENGTRLVKKMIKK